MNTQMASVCKNWKTKRTEKRKAKAASSVTGSWKMLGYINPGKTEMRSLPDDQGRGIVLTFTDDGQLGRFYGHTKMNEVFGAYTVTGPNTLEVSKVGGTKVGEPKWGTKFWRAMKVVHSWEIKKKGDLKHLHLIFDEANAKAVFEEVPPQEEEKEK